MGTIAAIGAGLGFLYCAGLLVTMIWGRYEVNPEEYHQIADVIKRYPHLGKHLLTFRKDGRITVGERRAIMKEARDLSRRHQTSQMLEQRKQMILQYMDDQT